MEHSCALAEGMGRYMLLCWVGLHLNDLYGSLEAILDDKLVAELHKDCVKFIKDNSTTTPVKNLT